jgi:hypothetical protein
VGNKIRCTHDGCNARAYWGKEEQDLALRCGAHKEAGDVNLAKLRCVGPECKGARSAFGNLETDGVGKRCKAHKQEWGASRRELRAKRPDPRA